MSMAADLGLEADSILGFLGIGLFAYGLGSGRLGIAAVGAGVSGWFGGLALARIGGLTAVVQSLTSTSGAPPTANTNGSGQGTP
jgi:hypothetical protein